MLPTWRLQVRKIRKMGYPAVQLSQVGPIPPEEILKIVTGEGLTICATHESGELLFNEPERVVDKLRTLGCRLTAYPFPKGIDFKDAESIRDFARKLDKAGATLRKAGITLAYHNHDIEFLRFEDTTVLEYIYSHTDPSNLAGEIDTYWISTEEETAWNGAGSSRNRLPLLHIRIIQSRLIDRQSIATSVRARCHSGA